MVAEIDVGGLGVDVIDAERFQAVENAEDVGVSMLKNLFGLFVELLHDVLIVRIGWRPVEIDLAEIEQVWGLDDADFDDEEIFVVTAKLRDR